LPNIYSIELSHNNLYGPLPPSLAGGGRRIFDFYVDNNNITGFYKPPELFNKNWDEATRVAYADKFVAVPPGLRVFDSFFIAHNQIEGYSQIGLYSSDSSYNDNPIWCNQNTYLFSCFGRGCECSIFKVFDIEVLSDYPAPSSVPDANITIFTRRAENLMAFQNVTFYGLNVSDAILQLSWRGVYMRCEFEYGNQTEVVAITNHDGTCSLLDPSIVDGLECE